jgi:effector-binding domain-containing protein
MRLLYIEHNEQGKEEGMKNSTNYRIKEVTWEPKTFVCIREQVAVERIGDFIEDQCTQLLKDLQNKGLCTDGVPFSIIHSVNKEANMADIAAAVLCSEADLQLSNYEVFVIEGKILSTTHIGYFDDIQPAYSALEKFMQSRNYQKKLYIEEHLGNPRIEPNLNAWKTNLYCVVN